MENIEIDFFEFSQRGEEVRYRAALCACNISEARITANSRAGGAACPRP
jgi:hypothetical protein